MLKSVLETLEIKNFMGEHAPNPPPKESRAFSARSVPPQFHHPGDATGCESASLLVANLVAASLRVC